MLRLAAGEVLRIVTSAGGGFGDPLARDVAAIARDLQSGLVSGARAEAVYGVVFDEAGAIDPAATEARRAVLRAARPPLAEFLLGPEREEYDRIWPPALRAQLALLVMQQPPHIRQNLLRLVESTLTRRGEPVSLSALEAALAEAIGELSGAARRARLARRAG